MLQKTPFGRRRSAFIDAVASALGEPREQVEPYVRVPEQEHGDLSFPTFHLAKTLRTPPAVIAARVGRNANAEGMEFVEAGAYVNARFDTASYARDVIDTATVEGPAYGTSPSGEGRAVVIDYSSPNIAKPIGYHHIRSTVIGNALARIHKAHGWRVEGINYLGDWGTQFGMVAVGVELTPGLDARDATIAQLVQAYIRATRASQEGDERGILPRARGFFARMEAGEEGALAFWKSIRERSIENFERVYARLGVHFDRYEGESRYDRAWTSRTIDDVSRTLGVEESEGALIVRLPGMEQPVLLRKSDGTSFYATRDIAAAIDRHDRFGFDRSLYVVALDQSLHFKQVFGVLAGMHPDWASRCVHVGFGRVHNMSTREGKLVLLDDVLDEAVARAKEKAASATAGKVNRMASEGVLEETANAVGIGAIIFGDLRNSRTTDYDFDWDRILDFEGQTGPYVQYAHARAAGVLRRGGVGVPSSYDSGALTLREEAAVVRVVAAFPEAMEAALVECEPSRVAQYLLTLATAFARWYALGNNDEGSRILCGDERKRDARLALTEAVRITLAAGLDVLGIAAPSAM